MTACVQIGNSDDKLCQKDWAEFVRVVNHYMEFLCQQVHFSGGSDASKPWQNYCVVGAIEKCNLKDLKNRLARLADQFQQKSIALTVAETEMIQAKSA